MDFLLYLFIQKLLNEDDAENICQRIKEFIGEDIIFIKIIARDIEIKTKNKRKKNNI